MAHRMTNKHSSFGTLFLLLLLAFSASAENTREISFSNLSTNEGLSQGTVFDIKQDSTGLIWVATADGLNKYDGYQFTVYRKQYGNEQSIQSDYLRTLEIAANNQLLIGGKRGLTVYSIRKNSFRNYPMDKEILKIAQSNDSIFYLVSQFELFCYNTASQKVSSVLSTKPMQLFTAYQSSHGLLLGTNQGVFQLHNKQLLPFATGIKAPIQDMKESPQGLWFASEGQGLFHLSPEGKLRNFSPQPDNTNGIISSFIRRLEFDSSRRLWIGTMEGLSVLNTHTLQFQNLSSSSINQRNLSHNSIRSIMQDKQGGMWLGSYYGGLNYYHPLQNQFQRIAHVPFSNSLSNNIVSCIVESPDHHLWIGTNDKGLNRYEPKTGRFSYFNTENHCLLSDNVKAVLIDPQNIFVGSHGGGMTILNRHTLRPTHFTKSNSPIASNDVYSLLQDPQGNTWLATLDGLQIFHAESRKFSPIGSLQPVGKQVKEQEEELASRQIYTLYEDSRNRIWIGSELGIYTYSTSSRLLTHYNIGSAQKNERIHCFLEDHQGQMWVGMQSGLGLLNEKQQSIKVYTTNDGLSNNNVMGILEDSMHRLWISTNNGLSCISPSPSGITTRLYSTKDGLQSNQFNNYAYCKTHTGELFFGGVNGITHFFSERLIDNPFTPLPIISQLHIDNVLVQPSENSITLPEDVNFIDAIRLQPNQNSFSLTLSVPNYLSMKHDLFAYKLVGEDQQWVYTKQHRVASYSNLGAGKYTFEVKARNSDGKWGTQVKTLPIELLPFWWNTLWFRTSLALLLLLGAYAALRFYLRRQSLKNQLVLEKLEHEKKEEINQTKLRFFINISHEFKTPLTLIISPLQELLRKSTDKELTSQLEIMKKNANKLLHLVNQLMDYRRADLGIFALKVKLANLSQQIDDQLLLFNRLAKQKNIELLYENRLNTELVLYDRNYLDLMLSNLLSNAFKFTPANGAITIVTQVENKQLLLQVSDTGMGMSPDELSRAFERFYQASHQVRGTGVGLSLVKRLTELHHADIKISSQAQQGTTVSLRFPQNEDAYAPHEMAKPSGEAKSTHIHLSDDSVDLLVDSLANTPIAPTDSSVENSEKPSILVVEDDADVRAYLVQHLSQAAHIAEASHGKEALRIIEQQEIDLIITDLMMPVMDGMALCKAVKQNIKSSHIPIIMLTAKSDEHEKYRGYAAGADTYISKPFDLAVLHLRVRNILQSKHRMLKHYSDTLQIEPQEITFNELDREFLEKAKQIVENHLDDTNFSVDEFCKEMAMSRSSLHLKMKAITGESTGGFIKKLRFHAACKLLKDGRYTINEISLLVGFSAPSYFTTSFKKHFGFLPTEYIKRQKP